MIRMGLAVALSGAVALLLNVSVERPGATARSTNVVTGGSLSQNPEPQPGTQFGVPRASLLPFDEQTCTIPNRFTKEIDCGAAKGKKTLECVKCTNSKGEVCSSWCQSDIKVCNGEAVPRPSC